MWGENSRRSPPSALCQSDTYGKQRLYDMLLKPLHPQSSSVPLIVCCVSLKKLFRILTNSSNSRRTNWERSPESCSQRLSVCTHSLEMSLSCSPAKSTIVSERMIARTCINVKYRTAWNLHSNASSSSSCYCSSFQLERLLIKQRWKCKSKKSQQEEQQPSKYKNQQTEQKRTINGKN